LRTRDEHQAKSEPDLLDFAVLGAERVRVLIVSRNRSPFLSNLLSILAVLAFGAGTIFCQQANENEVLHTKISRARALAAAHNLDAAATELDGILSTTKDDSACDVARIMLMDVYLEKADYTKAQNLLEQTFGSRSGTDAAATGNYFALAGQAVNGAREHIARYRTFGINVADPDLPAEAVNDLNRLRLLLEKVGDQAKQLSTDNEKATDAAGLLEDVAKVRTILARDQQDREQWQGEFESARQKLAANETRMAALAPATGRSGGTQRSAPQANSNPAGSSQSSPTTSKPGGSGEQPATGNEAPAGAASPSGAVNVGSLTEKAKRTVKPSYPQVAKTAHVIGDVVVFLEVDEKGAVTKIDHSTGPKLLQPAAEEAARQWKFRPTVIDGKPAKVAGYISFRFSAP
jgi:TonB family protein